jgi:hypothetical protein
VLRSILLNVLMCYVDYCDEAKSCLVDFKSSCCIFSIKIFSCSLVENSYMSMFNVNGTIMTEVVTQNTVVMSLTLTPK